MPLYQEDIVPVELNNKLVKLLEDSSADFSSVGGSRDDGCRILW